MPVLGELVVKITGLTADFDRSIDTSEKKLTGFDKKIKDAGKTLTDFGKKASTFVTLPILGIGTAFVKSAVDAEETRSKFATVFKSMGQGAETVADTFASNFGLAGTKARQLLGDTGDLLSGFGFTGEAALEMSRQVNELAVDLASFTNYSGGAEGASAALTKALLGERESIKSLGIAITEADIKQLAEDKGIVGELDRQTKAALTLELALSQSKNAIGDFSRTQDSAANQMRQLQGDLQDLAESFGRELLPIVKDVLTFLRDLIKGFTSLDEGTKRTILTVAGLAAAIGPATAAIGALSGALAFLAANPIVLAIAGVAALGVILVATQPKISGATATLESQAEALKKNITSIEDYKTAIEAAFRNDPIVEKDYSKELENVNSKIIELQNSLNGTTQATGSWRDSLGAIGNSQQNLIQQAQTQKDIQEELNKLLAYKSLLEEKIAGQEEKNSEVKKKSKKQLEKDYEDMIKINEEYNKKLLEQLDDRIGLLEIERTKAIEEAEKVGADTLKINEYYDNEIQKLKNEKDEQLQNDKLERYIETLKKQNEAESANFNILYGDLVANIQSQNEYIEESRKKLRESQKAQAEQAAKEELAIENAKLEAIIDAEIEAQNKKKSLLDLYIEYYKENTKQVNDFVISSLNQLGDAFAGWNDARLAQIEEQRDAEGNLSETLKAEKKKLLEQNKAIAITESIISGILATAKTFAEFGGWPLGVIPAAITAGIAALRTASIVATPLPALADGGLVMPSAGGSVVRMAEAGVPEYAIPERSDVLNRLADRIVDSMPTMQNNIFQPNNNISFPNNLNISIDGQQFRGWINDESRNGRIQIDFNRGIAR